MSFSLSIDQSYLLRYPLPVVSTPGTSSLASNSINVNVYPEWYSHMTLSWDVPSQWGACLFNVYFSDGGKDYLKLTANPISDPFFKDSLNTEYSRFENGTYIVEAILPGGATSVRSLPVFTQYKRRGKIEKIALEIQRREFLLLSKFSGVKSFVFRKRTYGQRCTRCWNETLEKVMDDHCEVCYGTSWEGGYFDPISTFIQYEINPTAKAKEYHGVVESNAISAWTISMPSIVPDDVIIRSGDFHIYKVTSLNTTELQAKPVRQLLGLTQLPKTDIENKLYNRQQFQESSGYLRALGGRFNSTRFPDRMIDINLNNDYKWSKPQNLTNLPKYTL